MLPPLQNGHPTAAPASDLHAPPPALPRAAAVLALVAPPAMAVVAGVALAGNAWIAGLAVVLVVLISGALWLALTTRGALRVLGSAGAVLATAGLVIVLATHWQGIVVLLLLALLLARYRAG